MLGGVFTKNPKSFWTKRTGFFVAGAATTKGCDNVIKLFNFKTASEGERKKALTMLFP